MRSPQQKAPFIIALATLLVMTACSPDTTTPSPTGSPDSVTPTASNTGGANQTPGAQPSDDDCFVTDAQADWTVSAPGHGTISITWSYHGCGTATVACGFVVGGIIGVNEQDPPEPCSFTEQISTTANGVFDIYLNVNSSTDAHLTCKITGGPCTRLA
jgi:hypothetical protein